GRLPRRAGRDRRGVGALDPGDPDGRRTLHARSAPLDDAPRVGLDRERRFDPGIGRRPRLGRLHHRQGGPGRLHPQRRLRFRQAQHPGQRASPRRDRDPHIARAGRGPAPAADREHVSRAHREAARGGGRRALPGLRRSLLRHGRRSRGRRRVDGPLISLRGTHFGGLYSIQIAGREFNMLKHSLILFCALLLSRGAAAQVGTDGAILGTVKDSSGAVIAGADVTVKNLETGLTKGAVSDASGYFEIVALPRGTYSATVALASFKTWRQQPIELKVGELKRIAPVLAVGDVNQEVTVEGG